MTNADKQLIDLLSRNRKGLQTGIYSVCSAHPEVLQASMQQALTDDSILLVESTSNQVDQYGGYTGMVPQAFAAYVLQAAEKAGFPADRILLGGDHLGPNAWQQEPADKAMEKAAVLVTEYVKAGYTKIHLDASMYCSDDQGDRSKPLDDEIVAARAAELCAAAEDAWKTSNTGKHQPHYVIGTEVPVPGGAREEEEAVLPTSPEAAEQTIAITRKAFSKRGLEDAWERVIGLVVQPGVEFGDDQVFQYDRSHPDAVGLSTGIAKFPRLVYEAHSTDYQSESSLTQLVGDHFAILKVGPWLTFAYREAVFALSCIEDELLKTGSHIAPSRIKEILDRVMMENPGYWKKYYPGSETQQAFKRKYSFSDRSRYYWPDTLIQESINRLTANLQKLEIPLSLLSQFLPAQFLEVTDGKTANRPMDLIYSKIRNVIGIYSRACGLGR